MGNFDTQAFKRSTVVVKKYPELFLAYTLFVALSSLSLLVPLSMPKSFPQVFDIATPYAIIFLICTLCFLFFVTIGKHVINFSSPSFLGIMGVLFCVGPTVLTLVVPYAAIGPQAKMLLFAFGIILTVISYCVGRIVLGAVMGHLGMTFTIIYAIFGTILSVPFTALVLFLPEGPSAFGTLFLCALTVALLARHFSREGLPVVFAVTDTKLTMPWRFFITSFGEGLALGLLLTVFSGGFIVTFFENTFGCLIGGTAAFLFGLSLRIDYDRLIYRIGFAAISMGCLIFAVSGESVALKQFSFLVQLSGYTYLNCILWSLGSYLIRNCDIPPLWLVCWPCVSLFLGRCTGLVVGGLLTEMPLPGITLFSSDPVAAMSAAAACLFSFFALQLSSGDNMRKGWGFISPNDENVASDLENTCRLISKELRLTPRESDVLELLAKGKTRSEIAETLFVSQNTVKTHTRNLYSKLDVSSHKELMKFIELQQRVLDSHGTIIGARFDNPSGEDGNRER